MPFTIAPPKTRQIAANDQRQRHESVPVYDTPEEPLLVTFSGITIAEQRAALANFPGGRRFALAEEAA